MANVLGINLSELNHEAVLKRAAEFLNSDGAHYLVTPNPEIILKAQRDEELFYILNKADLSIADGFGLKIAGLLGGLNIPRFTGADLTLDLLSLAENKKITVAVLNWRGGLSNRGEIEASLRKKYPDLKFLVLDISRSQPLMPKIIKIINNFAPQLVFSTFGSPYQEKLIFHNLSKFPTVKLALGVGGAFDFITGQAKRAPKLLRTIGLEWLWRLIRPTKGRAIRFKRWKRIYNATVVFISRLTRAKINRFFYRPNVACLLYKKENNRKKILIVQREDDLTHWQLPQGGCDGQSLEKAGARELSEELNTRAFIVKAIFKNTYSYLFPPVSEQNSPRASRRFIDGYKGQKQGLCVAEFIGQDEDIKVNFWDHRDWKWVEEHDLIATVHPRRQESAKIFLKKFKDLNL
jgi:N-acetylglucosaminyldiphosphoundecaprenol N-acetyl-beta-D-mannosaminyltransferase